MFQHPELVAVGILVQPHGQVGQQPPQCIQALLKQVPGAGRTQITGLHAKSFKMRAGKPLLTASERQRRNVLLDINCGAHNIVGRRQANVIDITVEHAKIFEMGISVL